MSLPPASDPSGPPTRILVIDDNPDDRRLVARELARVSDAVEVREVGDPEALDAALADGRFDIAITDYRLRWSTGTEVLRRLKAARPDRPVIMFTASGSEEIAVEAMKEGLDDYITKTAKHYPRIPYAVRACLDRARSRALVERTLAAERLANARLQMAFETARMGTWQLDAHSGLLSYSEQVGPMFGRPRGFVHAGIEDWLADIHPDDRPVVEAAWRAALRGDTAYETEFRAVGQDGAIRWLASTGRVFHDGDGRPSIVAGIVRDVSEQRRGEAALRESEQRFREMADELQAMFEVLPVGIAIAHDPDADRITVTPRFAAMLGVDPGANLSVAGDALRAMPLRRMRDGVEIPPEELPLRLAARTGREVRDSYIEFHFDDGRRLHFMANAAPLFAPDGRVRGAIGAFIDVTALKRIQADLEAADRQKNEFLATLAHELRNPMAPIRYAVALLRPDAPAAALAHARATIERQSAQMARLLDDLLDMSRITRNVIELRLETLDLRQVVQEGVDAARPDAAGARHALEASLPTEPLWVRGDPTRLLQIAGNLLNNAIRYTPPGGRVDVIVERAGDQARLRVEDTGVGLSAEMLPRVFDLFSQVHKELSVSKGGLGIGLTVAKHLAELHGGSIRASSAGLGKGAQFVVTLPLAAAPLERMPLATDMRTGLESGLSVLVVDDNVDAADSLAALLRSHGATVRVAYDGTSAIATANATRPGAIVLDVGLPDISGVAVARELRKQPWAARTRIIAVTGWGQEEDRRATREAGMDLHLVKPVEAAALLAVLGAAGR